MKKIPVLATIREAYRFALENLGAIIGLIWLPMIMITVIGFFVMRRYYDAFADALASGNYATMGPEVLGLFCYLVAALLLSTMMSVPVTQLALGRRKTGALLHFAFGAMEWRLFRALVALIAFMVLPLLGIGILSGVMGTMGGHVLGPANPVMAMQFLIALFYLACAYFGLRLGFLLPAIAVAEEKALLSRAWSLSAGNFWRIFLVALATAAPVAICAVIAQTLVEGRQTAMPAVASSTAMAAAQLHAMSVNMPMTSGISFLVAPLLLGLSLGAGASIYRTLSTGGASGALVDEIA